MEPIAKKYEIEVAGQGRRTKVWRVIGRLQDEKGTLIYRGNSVFNKRDAQAIADRFNQIEAWEK